MQTVWLDKVRGIFGANRLSEAPVRVVEAEKPIAVLTLPRWAGRRPRHQVQVIEKTVDHARVWSPEFVDVSETVWLEQGSQAVKAKISEYVASSGGYRLNLEIVGESRRTKERKPCNTPGDLEWVDGLTRVRCPVRVTNLSDEGAQLTLSRPAPEIRSVRLRFDGRSESGTIRYCVQIGSSFLAGVEFS